MRDGACTWLASPWGALCNRSVARATRIHRDIICCSWPGCGYLAAAVPAVRGLSVLIGILTVWAIYRLGANLFDRRTGLLAALAMAIAPSFVVYSQETRMYALLALLFAWLLDLWYRLLYRRGFLAAA